MKCPKCNFEMEEGVAVCPSCGFSNTVNGVPVQNPVVEAPVVPAPVVEAPVVETPVVEAPAVDAPVVEAPVVETPAVEAPTVEATVAPAPTLEAPAVPAPAPIVDAPVVDAPVAPAPTLEAPTAPAPAPVVDAPVAPAPMPTEPVAPAAPTPTIPVEAPAAPGVQPTNVVETPKDPNAPKEKKPILIYIVIGILAVIVIILFVLLFKDGANNGEIVTVTEEKENVDTTGNLDVDVTENETSTGTVTANSITLYNIKFTVPDGFEVLEEENYYQIYNTASRKIFILENLYTGSSEELENGLNIIKNEYPNNGCTDIETKVESSNDINYGYVTYKYNGSKIEEIYTLLNGEYIVAFYNIQTDLVSTDEFINYATTVTKSGETSLATFSGSTDNIEKNTFTKKDLVITKTFE